MKTNITKLFKTFLFLLCLAIYPVYSQSNYTQTVKGKIFDNETQAPLIGVSVKIMGTNPVLGAITDGDGNFKILSVPLGRYNLQIESVGYESMIIPEILVSTGKEVVINSGLKQSITELGEVTVKAYSQKEKPLNTMASVSARSFTVEETRRYAGGIDDPARLASAFAGVTVGNLQDNAIIIRGNSPKSISWRVEGVEIPNPNHFSGGNVAGGGFVTIFSSQLLANSDFFTGAFPAEYGNALSGVFDMKLRNGNSERREYTFQAGMMGIDISSEGPFVKGRQASYLFNYRYSTTGLLSKMGLIPSEQVPAYQDLSFKLNFPTRHLGTFSLWGIGGLDTNNEPDDKDSLNWETDWDRIKYDWKLNTGAAGITHKLITGKQTLINTSIVASGTLNEMDATRLDNNLVRRPNWYFEDKSSRITLSTFVNHKFSARHTIKSGVNYHQLFYNLNLNGTINDVPETYQNFVKGEGQSSFSEFYIQSKYELSQNLVLNSGINMNYFALNDNFSVDPRISIKWKINPLHSLSFGYGKHSQMEELKIYLIKKEVNGQITYPNKNLELAQAHHFVLAYDWLINSNLRFKAEPYFQILYNVPGIKDSSFSMINFKQDWTFMGALENNSTGRNYGIDLTLERFLNNNYYYLITTSIFTSRYMGDDGVWRHTRYDKGFAVNILAGKEFFLGKNKVLGINGRLNFMGGERMSPVMQEESIQNKWVTFDENRAFERQMPAMYYLDFTITYRINKSRYSGVWALQMKNVLGSPIYEDYEYNYKTDKIQESKSVIVLPVLSYKVEF